jgi:hypothetical protein
MQFQSVRPQFTALALAATLFLAACGGGDAGPPAESIPPTVNISTSVVTGTALGAVTFTFTFSEDVGSTFTADAVTVSNGTKGTFTKVSATQYTLVVTPTAGSSGAVMVTVLANVVADLVGNKMPVAASITQSFDTRPPVVSVASSAAGTTATGDVSFTFSFSKDVGTSFEQSDITVTGGSVVSFTRNSGLGATVVVRPQVDATGTIAVSVPAGAVSDAGGNTNNAAATLSQAFNTAVPATTLVNFSETPAPVLTGFGGAEDATVVNDPTNASNKVAKVVKSAGAELWAGTTVSICPNTALVALPFTTANRSMSVRVWSPDAGIPVRLKIEDAADGGKSVETEATTTQANAWQNLTFNFAAPAPGTAAMNLAHTYNKASIFFNFGKTGAQAGGAKTYYFDDLKFVGSTFTVACPSTGGSGSGGASGSADTTRISFDEATAPALTGFGGAEDATIAADPTNASNKVARVVKSAGAELWAGTTLSTQANQAVPRINFSANKVITVRVYSPDANIPVRLKAENAADSTKSVETEATVTAANTWQTLSFDFSKHAANTAALDSAGTYNKLSIFFNFGKTGAQAGGAKIYFFEDVSYASGTGAVSGGGSTTAWPALTFSAAGTTYTLTGFGGAEDATVVADPADASNRVAKVIKSATAEFWAGTTVSTGANNTLPKIPFAAGSTRMTMRVYAPAAGIPVRLKVEDATDAGKSVETEAMTTVANAWQTLTFNFASQAANTAALNTAFNYTRASVFFNFGKTGAAGGAGTYYFDDLAFLAP